MDERKSLRQMESRNMQLENQINVKDEQIKTLNQFIERASQETQVMITDFRKFCFRMLENEIASGNIKTNEIASFPLSQLLDKVVAVHKAEQNQARKIYEKLVQRIEEKNMIITAQQTQLSQFQVRAASGLLDVSEEDIAEETERTTAYLLETNAEVDDIKPALETPEILDDNEAVVDFVATVSKETDKVVSAKKGVSKNKTATPDELLQQMKPEMWIVIEAIGNEGLSEQSDIKEYCKKRNPVSDTTHFNTVGKLLKMRILFKTRVDTGSRWFYTDEFTDTGRALFIKQYKKEPVESEVKRLTKEHNNLRHGYMIKHTANILREKFNYKSISTSRKSNYIKLSDGRASIPDIIAVQGQTTEYFEIECGNHIQAEFNEKCNKLKMVTKKINFVVPDADIMEKKLKPQIEKWIKDSGGNKPLAQAGITVYLTTLQKLKFKKWEYLYNMTEDSPIKLEN